MKPKKLFLYVENWVTQNIILQVLELSGKISIILAIITKSVFIEGPEDKTHHWFMALNHTKSGAAYKCLFIA